MSEGYSGTPLSKKLGIKPGMLAVFLNAPETLFDIVAPLPDDTQDELPAQGGIVDFVHAFYMEMAVMQAEFPALKAALRKSGMLWVSWPKKSAKTDSDIDGNIVRELGLASGLVDCKICAVDETWSAMKFTYRIKDR